MASIRQQQVAETIKRNFGLVLQQEGAYIYGSEPLVTVTNVKLTPDFSLAKIYLSVYNTDNKQAVILEMEDELSRLKHALSTRIRKQVRRIPDLSLFLDDTLDEMYRLKQVFDKLHDDKQMGDIE